MPGHLHQWTQGGFNGSRASLFKFVVKASAMGPKLKILLLENVHHLMSKEMRPVLAEILKWLVRLHFTNIKYLTIAAENLGYPHTHTHTHQPPMVLPSYQ